jgi:lactoylglutathione lyase/methylmalonyl-CoA/ethylmalonyl-CoA epimerase
MIKKIDHIGVAVKSIDEAAKIYRDMGLEVKGIEVVEEQKVKVAFIPVGESNIELLEATSPDSAIAKFIEQRGEGVQHIALSVDNIERELASLKAKGMRLIDEVPRMGAHGARIAFLHPKSTRGVLIELCERKH